MLKCGWSKTELPAGSFKEQLGSQTVGRDQGTVEEERDDDDDDDHGDHNDHDEDDKDDDEGDDDSKMQFASGYIHHWWTEAGRLLPAM